MSIKDRYSNELVLMRAYVHFLLMCVCAMVVMLFAKDLMVILIFFPIALEVFQTIKHKRFKIVDAAYDFMELFAGILVGIGIVAAFERIGGCI